MGRGYENGCGDGDARFFFDYRFGVQSRFGAIFEGTDEGASKITSKWGWYATLYHLAGGSFLDIDRVTEMKAESAFAFLSYELDLHISKRNPDIT